MSAVPYPPWLLYWMQRMDNPDCKSLPRIDDLIDNHAEPDTPADPDREFVPHAGQANLGREGRIQVYESRVSANLRLFDPDDLGADEMPRIARRFLRRSMNGTDQPGGWLSLETPEPEEVESACDEAEADARALAIERYWARKGVNRA